MKIVSRIRVGLRFIVSWIMLPLALPTLCVLWLIAFLIEDDDLVGFIHEVILLTFTWMTFSLWRK